MLGEYKMNNVKKLIEEKQSRLNYFVTIGLITQTRANEQVRQYAKLLRRTLE